jgi:hypothetical protein
MSSLRTLLGCLVVLALAAPAEAAFVARFDFSGQPGDQPATPGSVFGTGVTVSDLTRGPALAPEPGENSMNGSGWNSPALNPLAYYSFTVTPDAGLAVTLNDLTFADYRSGDGPTSAAVRTSVDNFAGNVFTFAPDELQTARLFAFGPAYTNLTGPVTVRIYAWGAGSAAGTYRLTSEGSEEPQLALTGETGPANTVVPAPPSVALALAGLPALLAARRFRKSA